MEENKQQTTNRLYWIVTNLRRKLGGFIVRSIKKRPVWSIVLFILLVAVLFVNRSGLQPLVLNIRKYSLLVLVISIIVIWYFKNWEKRSTKRNALISIGIILLGVASYFLGPRTYRYLSLYSHFNTMEKVPLNTLPETDFERIQPLNSITTLINQEALAETEDATPPKFVRGNDGNYYYSCAVGPSKAYKLQQLSKNMYKVLHVPANLPSPVFSGKYRADVLFDVGELLLFSKNTQTSVTKRFNLEQFIHCETADPFYVQDNVGHWVQVVPIIRWKGILFPRPVFGGVFIIHEHEENDSYMERVLLGKGDYVSPERIAEFSYLKGQNLLPKKVAVFTAESFRFANGFFAPMPFYHEGDIRIPNLPNDVNPQPFITYFKVPDDEKLYNFFGLEPYEEAKKGLSLSLLIPGDADDKVYYIDHRKSENAYIGSSAISAKIIESKKNYDWSKNYPAESRPFVRIVNGKARFLWLSTIVTKAGANGEYIGGSIPEITLTDATHGKVTWIDQDSLIRNETWIQQAENSMKDYWKN